MKRGWFGPRRLGWGVSPRSWQGWVVSVVFIAVVAANMRWLRPVLETRLNLPTGTAGLLIVGVCLAIFGVVIWLTYERDEGRG